MTASRSWWHRVCRFLGLTALSFLDGVVEAEAASPSGVSFLLHCPRCYGVGSGVMVEQEGCVVCAGDRWKMVYPMLGLWMEDDNSDFFPRCHSRVGMLVLEFDRVSEDILFRSDSFNNNGFVSGKLLWRSKKLLIMLISDGAASSSEDVVIFLPLLWRLLRWCRRRRIGAGFLHRFILSFQFCKIGIYVSCNLILSYKWDTNCYAKKNGRNTFHL
jgi:hypothetical protein